MFEEGQEFLVAVARFADPVTWPVAMFRAANKVVVPLRT
jgi:hypothetical protein